MTMNLTPAIPTHWYYAQDIYERERREIFQKEWLYAAHVAELQQPGQYLTVEIAGFPLLLLRDFAGELRGYHNVCRHRGAPLVTADVGRLASNVLSCRYHGWAFDLSGNFKSAPHCEHLASCSKESLSLLRVHLHEYRGLVFVHLGDEPRPFAEAMRDFVATVDSSGYAFADYVMHSKISREGEFNWKTWIDGYQECYHCPTIHPLFNRDFALNRYQVATHDGMARHSCQRRNSSETGKDQGLWLWLYPNLGLPCYEPGFYTLSVSPVGPRRTRLTYTFHFNAKQSQEEIDEFLGFVDKVTAEDMDICAKVQRNYENSVLENGLLHPERENGVVYFHERLRRAIAG